MFCFNSPRWLILKYLESSGGRSLAGQNETWWVDSDSDEDDLETTARRSLCKPPFSPEVYWDNYLRRDPKNLEKKRREHADMESMQQSEKPTPISMTEHEYDSWKAFTKRTSTEESEKTVSELHDITDRSSIPKRET